MNSKFVVFKDPNGFYNYQLMTNDELLLLGTGFKDKDLCMIEMKLVRNFASDNQYYEKRTMILNNKFQLRFNGSVIGSSKIYFTKFKMENMIIKLKEIARLAPIEDITKGSAICLS